MSLQIPKEAYNYKMEFKDWADWFIGFKSPVKVWNETPTHLICELMYYFGGLVCFLHAFRRGGRWPFIFIATIGHGIVVEMISYYVPDIDSFWHSQSMVVLLGRRLPLHILFVYTVFYYQAFWAAYKMNLNRRHTHIAVGLLGVLMDLPYDISGIRFINWIWHDTDPNIFERTYFVPWTSYMFHFTFACSMSIIMHNSRSIVQRKKLDHWQKGSLLSEIIAVLLTSLFSMPMGALMFTASYHILHDFLMIPTETVVLPILGLLLLVVWKADRNKLETNQTEKRTIWEKLLYCYLILHYLTFILINCVFRPETHISTSFHETVGDCDKLKTVKTILKDLQKREFLCATDFDEKYYDFSCLKETPPPGSSWYTLCGTSYSNRAEYIWIMCVIASAALIVFGSIHCKKEPSTLTELKVSNKQRKKRN